MTHVQWGCYISVGGVHTMLSFYKGLLRKSVTSGMFLGGKAKATGTSYVSMGFRGRKVDVQIICAL